MFKKQKLQNSSSRIYQVYALIDPRDSLVHYVGISVDAESRFYGHAHEVTGNYGESRWIKSLKKNGLSSILQILEEIDGDKAGAIACEKEQYWISEMLRLGHPLTNVAGNTRPYVRASAGELYRTSQKPSFSRDDTRANTAKKLPAIAEDEELLTVEEVARRLKVNQKRVYKLIQSGELEATNIGGEGRNIYRISLADFNRYLQSRKVRREN